MNKIKLALGSFMTAVMSFMFAFMAFADDADTATTDTTTTTTSTARTWITIAIYVVVLGLLFYFLIFRPQKKQKKKDEEMKASLIVGQDIVTIGGIYGKIVAIKDDVITVQTSLDNTLMDFKNWAIREVIKPETDEK